MSFAAEWDQLKQDALRKQADRTRLASAGTGPPTGGSVPDLGLAPAPVRAKASALRTAQGQARGKSKLDDAEAAGRTHRGWDAGAASDSCVGMWQRRLRELGDLVDGAAKSLTRGMDEQISDDVSVAAELKRSAAWLEGA
ncbi:hypothetical protein [Streptomyces sp. NPDC049906]|uniref:hypothetical protein n=1 Tax=Streptomyces sp. NPDC049906 TaxID=3155656 RepID=UPI00341E742F